VLCLRSMLFHALPPPPSPRATRALHAPRGGAGVTRSAVAPHTAVARTLSFREAGLSEELQAAVRAAGRRLPPRLTLPLRRWRRWGCARPPRFRRR